MEQLPSFFFYLCAAVLVPILIAHLVVRAEWRIVRNACFIWYGFLFLAFAGFHKEEGIGWALIFAMFFSILAVPLISLVLKLWTFLGRNSGNSASTDPARRFWQRLPVAVMSPAQWLAVALILGGFLLYVELEDRRDLMARADVLRQLFELPADTKLTEIRRISKSPVSAPKLEAIVRFTNPQFEAYASALGKETIWRKGAPTYDGGPLEVVAPENVGWRELPVPARAGDRRVAWGGLSATEALKMRQGRALCIALQRKRIGKVSWGEPRVPKFTAKDCSDLARSQSGVTVVLGALDFDTRTLHMLIR